MLPDGHLRVGRLFIFKRKDQIMEITKIIGSMIVGGLITFYCAKHYYKKAAKDLKEEATRLRDLIEMILHGMEIANLVTLTKDAQGNPVSFALKINVHDAVSLAGTTSPVLTQTVKEKQEKEGG
jgi:hypothetical protein